MPTVLQGNSAVNVEVETNTRAMRTVIRPNDVAALGSYAIGMTSGVMAAGLAANADIFSFRFAPSTTTNICLVRRVLISAGNTATAFTAGVVTFNLFAARSFTASQTGGTAATVTGNNQKLRTSFAAMGVADIRISSTAALGAGTKTLDAQPLGSVSSAIVATAGSILVPLVPLLDTRVGEWPDVIANNEGLTIQGTVPATGTWTFSASVTWEEVSTYGTGLAT